MTWVPYSERDEWKDVVPIPQDDGENPVVAIQYTGRFRETMDYLRALLGQNELSERALELTEDVIDQNAGNYTVWVYRRAVIDAIGRDWTLELAWVSTLAESHPKNYQIWQHRRSCLEKIVAKTAQPERLQAQGEQELAFLSDFLTSEEMDDAKNYHAWAHRQWVVRTFALWERELPFVELLVLDDVRNNSAWNHRFFVVTRGGAHAATLDERQAEVRWALDKAALAPHNESAWSYLRGMMGSDGADCFGDLEAQVAAMCRQHDPAPPLCLELMADLLLRRGDAGAREEARQIFERLGGEVDVIRKRFWNERALAAGEEQ